MEVLSITANALGSQRLMEEVQHHRPQFSRFCFLWRVVGDPIQMIQVASVHMNCSMWKPSEEGHTSVDMQGQGLADL